MAASLTVYNSFTKIQWLREQWNELAQISRSPLVSFEWFEACAQALHASQNLFIVVAMYGDECTGIAPLVEVRRQGQKSLTLIGSSVLFEPGDLLYKDERHLGALVEGVVKLGYPVRLARSEREVIYTRYFNNWRQARAFLRSRPASTSAFIEVEGSWDEFFSTLSRQRRYELRRKYKRLSRHAQVSTEITSPGPEQLEDQFEKAVSVEAKSWKLKNCSALAVRADLREFFECYLREMAKRGLLRFCFLYADEQCIAMHIGVVSNDRLWILKIGYDESWARCSPGILLANETIKYCFEHRLKGYEFLGSFEHWQRHWPVRQRRYYDIILYPLSARGFFGLSIDTIKGIARQLKFTASSLTRIRAGGLRDANKATNSKR